LTLESFSFCKFTFSLFIFLSFFKPLKMRFIFLFLLCFPAFAFAQEVKTKTLSSTEINSAIPADKRPSLKIQYPIKEAYQYSDKLGTHYLVLTEYANKTSGKVETVEAIFLDKKAAALENTGGATDFIQDTEVSEEHAITWQSSYCLAEDMDGDGEAEVLLTYSSLGINDLDDGRLKMLCYHKGKKYAIRHQNGTLDFERKTTIDRNFYALPKAIQTRIAELMTQLEAENKAIFPAGWQEGMKKKQTLLKE